MPQLRLCEIMVASGNQRGALRIALQNQAGVRLVWRQRDRRIEQRLVFTTRPGSRPHDADTITFGLASAMRDASSAAAKPPNTTEWIAPNPRAGQHGDRRLRHHRQVDHHPVAARHAECRQRAGELRGARSASGDR